MWILFPVPLRFQEVKKDNFKIIAAVCHPKFKLTWIDDETEKNKAKALLEEEVRRTSNAPRSCDRYFYQFNFYAKNRFVSDTRNETILQFQIAITVHLMSKKNQ